jgi:acyl-CoA synthetase (AMP-forming)/AMP-acid ligase II
MAEDGERLLGRGEIGEIVVRGPGVLVGYESNDAANSKAFAAGWFRTGDQGHFDTDGFLWITGRLKEMINRGGEKVSPLEVEAVLLRHSAITNAAVFPVPDPVMGEEVGAVLVLRAGSALDANGVRDFCSSALVDHKIPRAIVFVDEIPRGPTGKIQRLDLASRLGLRSSAR